MTEPHALTKAEPTAVTRPARTIKQLLQGEEIRAQVAAALPRHLTPERFIRVALNATMRNPQLLNCTPESFFRALLDLSAFGLEPDGRRAHLVPYGKECTLVIDYKGLAELCRRSGDVSYIHADVVYPGDEWSYSFGTNAHLRHVPNLDVEHDPKTAKAVYSFVKLRDGSEDFIVISRHEVEEIRRKYSKQPDGPAWTKRWGEMAKKTGFRLHSKWLPLSEQVRTAIERDEATETALPGIEKAVLSLDALKPSADENRGHDHTEPGRITQADVDRIMYEKKDTDSLAADTGGN